MRAAAGRPADTAASTVWPLVLAAVATWAVRQVLPRWCPGGTVRWERTNHAGAPVTLLEGPALVIGATSSAVATGWATRSHGTLGPAAATAAAGVLGALDDLGGSGSDKGLRGHLHALAGGRVTTGSIKVVGLALAGAASARLIDGPVRCRGGGGLASTLLGGAVIAGCANVVNLFDLRPGRALKVVLLVAAPLAVRSGSAGIAVGSALALVREDLAGRAMLGDTGANSAGALVGTAILERVGLPGRVVALGVVLALTLASERVSFTQVIESTPGLRELDALGRVPRMTRR